MCDVKSKTRKLLTFGPYTVYPEMKKRNRAKFHLSATDVVRKKIESHYRPKCIAENSPVHGAISLLIWPGGGASKWRWRVRFFILIFWQAGVTRGRLAAPPAYRCLQQFSWFSFVARPPRRQNACKLRHIVFHRVQHTRIFSKIENKCILKLFYITYFLVFVRV